MSMAMQALYLRNLRVLGLSGFGRRRKEGPQYGYAGSWLHRMLWGGQKQKKLLTTAAE